MLRISPNSSDEVNSANSVQQIQPVQNGRSSITFFIEHITFNFTPYFEQNSREINSACFFPWFRTLQEPITTKDKQVWNPQLTNWCENFEISILYRNFFISAFAYFQARSSIVKKLIRDSWGTKFHPCHWVYKILVLCSVQIFCFFNIWTTFLT